MRTEFGKFTKKLRVDNNETMREMAAKLGVSSAYLSAIELGKKHVPQRWRDRLIKDYELDEERAEELDKALEASQMFYRINTRGASEVKHEAARRFVYGFKNMSDETAQEMIDILKQL